ncbi:hypothetical protein AB0M28_18475 [Streptomyces sp. NPDC051940]|uniref:hypothetical protein n=1 Tax=Streptomyces sp. NPDC051940 TaxID=3155675 RepID=UPI0034278C81
MRAIRPSIKLPDTETRSVLLGFQERIDTLLADDGPADIDSCGKPIPAATYFEDLRFAVALTLATWPAVELLAPNRAIARIVEGEAQRLRIRAHRGRRGTKAETLRMAPFIVPPTSSLVRGAVLNTAAQLLEGWNQRSLPIVVGGALRGHGGLRRYLQQRVEISAALRSLLEAQLPRTDRR